jgi:hypothetical protein
VVILNQAYAINDQNAGAQREKSHSAYHFNRFCFDRHAPILHITLNYAKIDMSFIRRSDRPDEKARKSLRRECFLSFKACVHSCVITSEKD